MSHDSRDPGLVEKSDQPRDDGTEWYNVVTLGRSGQILSGLREGIPETGLTGVTDPSRREPTNIPSDGKWSV